MTDALRDYLASAGDRDRDDPLLCCTFPADWVVAQRGVDPAGKWRGRYNSDLGVALALHRRGGLADVFAAECAAVGLEPTERPERGDIGVVMLMTESGLRPCGAICTGPRWAAMTAFGQLALPAHPLTAWRV